MNFDDLLAKNKRVDEARDRSKQSEKDARAARKSVKCRTCGRKILENVRRSGSERVDGVTVDLYATTGDFGPYCDGICTLRCGYRYASRVAPKLTSPT